MKYSTISIQLLTPIIIILSLGSGCREADPSVQPRVASLNDPIAEATFLAVEAVERANTTEMKRDWQAAVLALETALERYQTISPKDSSYEVIQQRVDDFTTLLEEAKLKAESSPTAPKVEIDETIKTQTYLIVGNTSEEINLDLDKKRVAATGESFDGLAQWTVSWNYQYHPTERGCEIKPGTLKVSLTGQITIPEWHPPQNADPELVNRWNLYINRLHAHERRHISHGRAAAEKVHTELTLLTAPTCDQFNALAEQSSQLIMDVYIQRDKDYDLETQHGQTEGIIRP